MTELREEIELNLFQLQLKLYFLMIMFENLSRNFEETCKVGVASIYKQTLLILLEKMVQLYNI